MSRTNLTRLFRSAVSRSALAVCLVVGLAVIVPPSAYGTQILHTLDVTATAGGDSGNLLLNLPVTPGVFNWSLPSATEIMSTTNPGVVIATINSINLTLDSDPSVALSFSMTAGAAPTNITVSSPIVSFANIPNASGFASAAVTVTDLDSSPDGATATGVFPGIKSYQAVYNGSSVFANLVSPVTAPTDSSNIASERFPGAGNAFIGAVSSMQSSFSFLLTAKDSASGTSQFKIVPEPSTLVLALFGGLGLLWRARRRWA